MLDSGAATSISDPALASVLATEPGGSGTLWIAGHHSSHPGAFAHVPTLADGTIITMSNGATTARYRVVDRVFVNIRNNQVVNSSANATESALLTQSREPMEE